MRALALLPLMGVALGQCWSVAPGAIPSLAGRPVASLQVSPEGLAAPGVLRVQAQVPGYVLWANLTVRGALRWGDHGPRVLKSWTGASVATAEVGPLGSSVNGIHTFSLQARVCYRLGGAVVEDTLTAEARASVYIPWSTSDLPWLLWREAEAANYIHMNFFGPGGVAAGQPMSVEGLVSGLAEPVRAVLRNYLVGGYLNQGSYPPECRGICYSVAPVQLRLYAVEAEGVRGLYRQGWARLGLFGGPMDSQAWAIGGRGVAGVMIVRGYRHDYILLSSRGDFGDSEVQVVEMPKGGSELFRRALSLAALQQGAQEVRP